MRDSVERVMTNVRGSQTLRLLTVGFLALILLIPVGMISGLVSEREQRRREAISEVSSSWGNAQTISGPALMIPYAHRSTETLASGQVVTRTETRTAVFLPKQLTMRGTIDSENRQRGIFSVPVYRMTLTVEGEFDPPQLGDLGISPTAAEWPRASLAVGISDARAIQEQTSVTWNGRPIAFLPGTRDFVEGAGAPMPRGPMDYTSMTAVGPDIAGSSAPGIHAVVGSAAPMTERVRFSFPLTLNGSLSVHAAPFGETTVVELQADHGSPSFQGNWLPTERTITEESFTAKWSIPFLGRSYPQSWVSGSQGRGVITGSLFGVELVNPVDHYRMTSRSVKYASLFIVLTFATVWLIEVLSGMRVHSIQYLMLGGALCLFYLLELSLSEHLGFALAYVIASVAIVGMIAAYSIVVLRRMSRALVVGAGVAVLYAYLYMLLMNEDYALLIGSIGLFAILGGIMYATRNVNWHGVGAGRGEGAGA